MQLYNSLRFSLPQVRAVAWDGYSLLHHHRTAPQASVFGRRCEVIKDWGSFILANLTKIELTSEPPWAGLNAVPWLIVAVWVCIEDERPFNIQNTGDFSDTSFRELGFRLTSLLLWIPCRQRKGAWLLIHMKLVSAYVHVHIINPQEPFFIVNIFFTQNLKEIFTTHLHNKYSMQIFVSWSNVIVSHSTTNILENSNLHTPKICHQDTSTVHCMKVMLPRIHNSCGSHGSVFGSRDF